MSIYIKHVSGEYCRELVSDYIIGGAVCSIDISSFDVPSSLKQFYTRFKDDYLLVVHV